MRKILTLAVMVALFATMGAALADDHVEGDEVEDSAELSDAQLVKAALLADYFGDRLGPDDGEPADPEDTAAEEALEQEIIALRTGEDGITVGWGALYKLLLVAEATDSSLVDVIAERGDGGWAFGTMLKALRDEDPDWRGDTPRNLGQFKKQQREAAAATEGADAHPGRGHGKDK